MKMRRTYRYGELPWRCIQQRLRKREKKPMRQQRRWMALHADKNSKPRRACDWELRVYWVARECIGWRDEAN